MNVFVVMLLALAGGPAASPPAPQFGIVVSDTSGVGCLAGTGLRLAAGDSLTLLPLRSIRALRGSVTRRLAHDCEERQGVFGDSVFTYAVTVEGAEEMDWGLGLGISSPGVIACSEAGQITFQVPGIAGRFALRDCASHEGVHIFVRKDGKLLYHEYYYVPYDLEYDCTDADFADVPAGD